MAKKEFFSKEKPKEKTLTCEEICEDCGLYKHCKSQPMKPSGSSNLDILLITEFPEAVEDEKGSNFLGPEGSLLRDVIFDLGFDLEVDFLRVPAVRCRPKKGLRSKEINACRHYLFMDIERYKPKVIIPIGKVAIESLLGDRIKNSRMKLPQISDWVGKIIEDQELECFICPIYPPTFIFRNEKDKFLLKKWMQQIKRAIAARTRSFYKRSYRSEVLTTTDVTQACKWLKSLIGNYKGPLAFDYETTGKKPHRKEHFIHTASISDGLFAYAFPFFKDKKFQRLWKHIMYSPSIKLIAHNAPFEHMWTMEKCGYPVRGWYWDTLLAGHCIDNRISLRGLSLKFLAYCYFGDLGYDDKVDYFIQHLKEGENSKDANAINRIDEAPMEELLEYNGLDSLYTHMIMAYQKTQMPRHIIDGFNLFLTGSKNLTETQQTGFCIDYEQLLKKKESTQIRLDRLSKKIIQSKEVQQLPDPGSFNQNSTKQLSHLLFDVLKMTPIKSTKGGNPSVDFESLESFDLDVTKKIVRFRKWKKARDNYILGIERETVDGVLHPFFNLSGISTYRSSSSSINVQNIYKRDAKMRAYIRSVFKSRLGNRLIGWDYGSFEVRIIACYSKDRKLIGYIVDGGDMHRDQAAIIFIKNPEDISKEERQISKNMFVFPEFYGDFYKQIAQAIWNAIDSEAKKHFKSHGIKNYRDFEYHIECIEKDFRENKFPGVFDWHKHIVKNYEHKGYAEMHTGFRCYAPMKRTEIINYRIQGSAFHCLMWTYNQIHPKIKKMSNSYLLGEIHDEILGDIHPSDEAEVDNLVYDYGTQKIREYWDWIIVPLEIEKEYSNIDGNWATMHDGGILKT